MKITLISFSLIILIIAVLIFRPVPIVSENQTISESGIVTEIYRNKGNDIIFVLENTKRRFYINRGLESGLELKNLKEKYNDLPVELKEEDDKLIYEFKQDSAKQKYLEMLSLEETVTPYEMIRALALIYNNELVDEIILESNIVYYAQQELLNYGINPNISVATW